MEANICDINHLDADVLLPPRKRLLAGFKKQSSNGNGVPEQPTVATPSADSPASASPSTYSSSSDFNTHLNKLLSSHVNDTNLSTDEILEESRSAAIAAAKVAEAARAAAEEKAAIAAKALAAAKSALDLVASFSEETASKDRYLKRNKLKKHVPVQLLYKKHRPIENHRTDEDLARRLHRVMNSSPRISRNSSSSEWKGHKHKRPKNLPTYEKAKVSNGSMVLRRSPPSTSNGYAVAGVIDSDDSTPDISVKEDANEAKYDKTGQPELGNGEAESSYSKEKSCEGTHSPGKKRGRVKLKKLPLSICSSRDQVNPKEDMTTKSSPLTDKNVGNPASGSKPLFTLEPSADGVISMEAPPMWKCQEFKAPACIKQNKVMQ